jgi:hypothetical protein
MPSIIISSTGNKTRFLTNRFIASLRRLAVKIRSVIAKEDIRLCDAGQGKTRVPVSTLGERSAYFHRSAGMRPVISALGVALVGGAPSRCCEITGQQQAANQEKGYRYPAHFRPSNLGLQFEHDSRIRRMLLI